MSKVYEIAFKMGGQISGTFTKAMKGAEHSLGGLQKQVSQLNKEQKDIGKLQDLQMSVGKLSREFSQAQNTAQRLGQELSNTVNPTKKQKTEFDQARQAASKLKSRLSEQRQELHELRGTLKQSGKNYRELADRQKELAAASDRARKAQESLQKVMLKSQKVSQAASQFGSNVKNAMTQATIAGAGAGYFFKTQFLDTAAQFEKFRTILKTVEGSSAKAQASMDWISDFATTTPYDLQTVTDSFVKLRAYGLDPTNGLLRTLGDTSSAMGKDVMQAVEAIADAVTGENERLKEFGIRASKSGGTITYEYTNKDGEQMTAEVDANNRKMIESTLSAIFNEKYAGAMDDMSKTWAGMVSNLSDQWTRFANMTMKAGVFDFLKGKLSGFLDIANKMAADGRLEKYAKQTAEAFIAFGKGLWSVGQTMFSVSKFLSGLLGGWDNLLLAVAALKFAPLILSAYQLGASLVSLTASAFSYISALSLAAIKSKAYMLLTKSMAIAQLLFNKALFAAKWVWATARIIALKAAQVSWLAITKTITAAQWLLNAALFAAKWVWATARIIALKAAQVSWLAITKTITAAQWLFNAALSANPIGLVIVAITALIAAGVALYRSWDTVTAFFGKMWENIKAWTSKGIQWLTSVFTNFHPLGILIGSFGKIDSWLSNFSLYSSGKKIIQTLSSGIMSKAKDLINSVKGVFAKVRDYLPFSDAKVGPFSDLTKSGAAIMSTLAEGAGREQSLQQSMSGQMQSSRNGLLQSAESAAGGMGGGSIVVHLSQNISVPGGDNAAVREQAAAGAREGVEGFESKLNELMNRRRRLSYG